MDLQDIVNELQARVARLEASKQKRRVFNQQEAARELNMSVSKLREEQRAGRIKGVLNGRIWTFTDEEIERYLGASDAA
jgi:hypothetical protein